MASLKIFVAVVLVLIVKHGALSCSLRTHKSGSSRYSATSTLTSVPHDVPALSKSSFGQYPDTVHHTTSNLPDSFSFPIHTPTIPDLPVLPVLSSPDHNLLLMNLLLKHPSFASTPIVTPIPLTPSSSSSYYSSTPIFPIKPTFYPTFEQNPAILKEFISFLLSTTGSSTPESLVTPSSIPVSNTIAETVPTDIPSIVSKTALLFEPKSNIEPFPTNTSNDTAEFTRTFNVESDPTVASASVPGVEPVAAPDQNTASDATLSMSTSSPLPPPLS